MIRAVPRAEPGERCPSAVIITTMAGPRTCRADWLSQLDDGGTLIEIYHDTSVLNRNYLRAEIRHESTSREPKYLRASAQESRSTACEAGGAAARLAWLIRARTDSAAGGPAGGGRRHQDSIRSPLPVTSLFSASSTAGANGEDGEAAPVLVAQSATRSR
jgi:hypothetical protein